MSKFNFNIDNLDSNSNFEKSTYNTTTQAKQYIISQSFEDLGLPSGTLWAKFNLGAPAARFSHPEYADQVDYIGDFYAWGEIKDRLEFSYDDYIFYDPSTYKVTKYDHGMCQLYPEDDAVYMSNKYGTYIAYIPTINEVDEFLQNTEQEHVRKYNNIEKLNGVIYTSKINGKSIFIPYTKMRTYSVYNTDGTKFGVWTSTSATDREAYILYSTYESPFSTYSNKSCIMQQLKHYGLNIRPICRR